MVSFKLLRRFHGAHAATEASIDNNNKTKNSNSDTKDATVSRKSSKKDRKQSAAAAVAGSGGHAAVPSSAGTITTGSKLVPQIAPRLDLSISRTPSPPLVDVSVDGDRNNSPWVDLAAEAERSSPGSFGFGSLAYPSHTSIGGVVGSLTAGASSSLSTQRAVGEKLQNYLDDKRINVEEATILVRECSQILRQQGLETLGLFRPWRFAEVPHTVARTLALFLRAVYPDDNVPLEDKDLLGFVNLTNDHALDAFRDALQHAGIHNVVACLKWGYRHLNYGSGGFADSADGQPWRFYTNFLDNEVESRYAKNAFTNILLDSLPDGHRDLLLQSLSLIASVAAHDSQNAMPGLRLCRLLGFWLFGRQHSTWKGGWVELYNDYLIASSCLEHIFLAYLRADTDLPLRLKELLVPYAPEDMGLVSTGLGRPIYTSETWESLHVVVITKNPALSSSASKKAIRRRLPGTLIAAAIKAPRKLSLEETPQDIWIDVVDRSVDGEGVDLQTFVADETERVFDIVAERAQNKHVRLPKTWQAPSSNNGHRRRSASIDVGAMNSPSRTSSTSTNRNRAVSNGAQATIPEREAKISWGDFESKGFSDEFDSDAFSLFSEVGRPSMDEDQLAQRPHKLKKPYPYASLAVRHLKNGRLYHSDLDDSVEETKASNEIETLEAITVDPIFADFYLDALADPAITVGWPLFAVAELKDVAAPYKALVVELENHPPVPVVAQPTIKAHVLPSAGSMAKAKTSTATSKQKRGFLSMTKRKRMSEIFTRSPSQEKQSSLTDINELGQVVASGMERQLTNGSTPGTTDDSRLPVPAHRPPIPTIIKTSPLTPPRQVSPPLSPVASAGPAADATASHDRGNPSPTSSKASSGKKVSRKPPPHVEEVFGDVIEAPELASEGQPTCSNVADVAPDESVQPAETEPVLKGDDGNGRDQYKPVEKDREVMSQEAERLQLSAGAKQARLQAATETGSSETYISPSESALDGSKSDILESPLAAEEARPSQDLHQSSLQEEKLASKVVNGEGPNDSESTDANIGQSRQAQDADSDLGGTIPHVTASKYEQRQTCASDAEQTASHSPPHLRGQEIENSSTVSVVSKHDTSQRHELAQELPTSEASAASDIAEPTGESFHAEGSPSATKRIGGTFNRVSPSLKARFGSGSAKSAAVTAETASQQESPTKRTAPASPSKRSALLLGARKILGRKKSNVTGSPDLLFSDGKVDRDQSPSIAKSKTPEEVLNSGRQASTLDEKVESNVDANGDMSALASPEIKVADADSDDLEGPVSTFIVAGEDHVDIADNTMNIQPASSINTEESLPSATAALHQARMSTPEAHEQVDLHPDVVPNAANVLQSTVSMEGAPREVLATKDVALPVSDDSVASHNTGDLPALTSDSLSVSESPPPLDIREGQNIQQRLPVQEETGITEISAQSDELHKTSEATAEAEAEAEAKAEAEAEHNLPEHSDGPIGSDEVAAIPSEHMQLSIDPISYEDPERQPTPFENIYDEAPTVEGPPSDLSQSEVHTAAEATLNGAALVNEDGSERTVKSSAADTVSHQEVSAPFIIPVNSSEYQTPAETPFSDDETPSKSRLLHLSGAMSSLQSNASVLSRGAMSAAASSVPSAILEPEEEGQASSETGVGPSAVQSSADSSHVSDHGGDSPAERNALISEYQPFAPSYQSQEEDAQKIEVKGDSHQEYAPIVTSDAEARVQHNSSVQDTATVGTTGIEEQANRDSSTPAALFSSENLTTGPATVDEADVSREGPFIPAKEVDAITTLPGTSVDIVGNDMNSVPLALDAVSSSAHLVDTPMGRGQQLDCLPVPQNERIPTVENSSSEAHDFADSTTESGRPEPSSDHDSRQRRDTNGRDSEGPSSNSGADSVKESRLSESLQEESLDGNTGSAESYPAELSPVEYTIGGHQDSNESTERRDITSDTEVNTGLEADSRMSRQSSHEPLNKALSPSPTTADQDAETESQPEVEGKVEIPP